MAKSITSSYVSIHAPVQEATANSTKCRAFLCFNPRPRTGGDALYRSGQAQPSCVSIHAPVQEATDTLYRYIYHRASFNPRPRTGGDVGCQYRIGRIAQFQSTPPYRRRRAIGDRFIVDGKFQSTPPYRRRLTRAGIWPLFMAFQSTPPYRRRRQIPDGIYYPDRFQSTPPYRRRQLAIYLNEYVEENSANMRTAGICYIAKHFFIDNSRNKCISK